MSKLYLFLLIGRLFSTSHASNMAATRTSFGFFSSSPLSKAKQQQRNPLSSQMNIPISKTPVVICPGFGNDEIDYVNPLNQGTEAGFVSSLIRRGFDPDLIFVLPLQRYEWIRVAGGLLDIPNFYTGNARPEGFGYGWYVQRLRRLVNEAYEAGGCEGKVILMGHSAGGWLARAALGDGSWEDDLMQENAGDPSSPSLRASDRVRALVTIGAIHKPPAGDAAATCVTRGALAYVEANYPGAFLANEGISYISVGGDAIVGNQSPQTSVGLDDEKIGSNEANSVYKVRGERSASTVAYTAYEAVSGRGELTGDGVVPLEWSLLDGSCQISLDGVLHSINEAGTTIPTDRWYGSEGVVDRWLLEALEEMGVESEYAKENSSSELPWSSLFGGIFSGKKLLT